MKKEKVFYYIIGIILVIILLLCFNVFSSSDNDKKKSDGERINNTDSMKKNKENVIDDKLDSSNSTIDFTFDSKTTPLDNTIMILEIIKSIDECDNTYKLELFFINYYMKYQVNDKDNYKTQDDREVLAIQKKLVVSIDNLLEVESKANIDKFKQVFKEYAKLASEKGN